MGKVASVRTALTEGGPRELVGRTRCGVPAPCAPPPRRRPGPPPGRDGAEAGGHGAGRVVRPGDRFFKKRQANYEALSDAIKPHLPVDGVLFDIGANIGYFSKVVGQRTGFRGSAHLFEPIPHLAQFCFRSLADLEFSVAVHQYGLGDTDGTVDIFIDTKGNFGWNTLIVERAAEMTPQQIIIRRFDGIGLTVVPSVIKIDVEGADVLVLRGLLRRCAHGRSGRRSCARSVGAPGHPAWDEELAVFGELLELGYRPTTLTGEPVVLDEVNKTRDILFLPASHPRRHDRRQADPTSLRPS